MNENDKVTFVGTSMQGKKYKDDLHLSEKVTIKSVDVTEVV